MPPGKQVPSPHSAEGKQIENDLDDGVEHISSCPRHLFVRAFASADFVDLGEEEDFVPLETIAEGEEEDKNDSVVSKDEKSDTESQSEDSADEDDDTKEEPKRTTQEKPKPDNEREEIALHEQVKNRGSVLWKMKLKAAKVLLLQELSAIGRYVITQREAEALLKETEENFDDIQLAVAMARISVVNDFARKEVPGAVKQAKVTKGIDLEETAEMVQAAEESLKNLRDLAMFVKNRVSPEHIGISPGLKSAPDDSSKSESLSSQPTEKPKEVEDFEKIQQWLASKKSDDQVGKAFDDTAKFAGEKNQPGREEKLARVKMLKATVGAVEKMVSHLTMVKAEEEDQKLKRNEEWKRMRKNVSLDMYESHVLAEQFKNFYVKKGLLEVTASGVVRPVGKKSK